MNSRRNVLAQLDPPSDRHLGLWVDKFLPEEPEGEKNESAKAARGKHLRDAASIGAPEAYRLAFERRQHLFESVPCADDPEAMTLVIAEAKAKGRLVVGLGEESVLEVGIHLDHTWGMPVIPGSALKGLAAATAHQLAEHESWRKATKEKPAGESYRTLFGDTDEQGKVAFLDAWWDPDSGKKPVHLDVMTVHHPEYYQTKDDPPPPSDTDSPNPVSFLSTTGTFVLAVEGPAEWCDAALKLLQRGLEQLGVGAKTNSGYGRMTLDWKSTEARREEEEKRRFDAKPLAERLPTLHAEQLKRPLDEQVEWLLGEGALPQYGATEAEWRAAVKATYAEAIALARQRASGEGGALAEAQAKLDEHLATPKPKKSDERALKRWKKAHDNLQKAVENAKRTDANSREKAESIRRRIAWLDDD